MSNIKMDENDAYGIAMTQVSCGYYWLTDHIAMWETPPTMQAISSDVRQQQSVSHDEMLYEEIDPNTTGFTISTNSAYSIVHP